MLPAASEDAWAAWWAEPRAPPVTVLLMCVLVLVSGFFNVKNASADVVSCNYKDVVQRREFWRVFAAPLAHKEPSHLLVSLLLLWDSRDVEQWIGPYAYARLVFHLVLLIASLHLGYVHFDASRHRGVRPNQTWSWHGMSAVIFALLMARFVLPYLDDNAQISMVGFILVPAPCSSALVVMLYSTVAQRSVAMVHAIGTIAGTLYVIGALDWVTPYLTFCAFQWCCVGLLAGKGFPPTFVSDEVVAQRRVEDEFAAQARQRRQQEGGSDDGSNGRGNGNDSNRFNRNSNRNNNDVEADLEAGEGLASGNSNSNNNNNNNNNNNDVSLDENELAYLLDMRIDIPPRLRPGARTNSHSGSSGSRQSSNRTSSSLQEINSQT